jgi:hypothetical protein
MAGEEHGHDLGVGDTALDAQAQGLQSLYEQEGIERSFWRASKPHC